MPFTADRPLLNARLRARAEIFERLHLNIFETLAYVHVIQSNVAETGQDISQNNTDYIQLLRDYEVTKLLSRLEHSELKALCTKTDYLIKHNNNAVASIAQLCAAATCALNLRRILCEIPAYLQDNDALTDAITEKFAHHVRAWKYIIADLAVRKID